MPPPDAAADPAPAAGRRPLRTWVKVTIAGVALAVLAFGLLAATSGYYFLRHLGTRTTSQAQTLREFDAIRARFGASRPPLVEIADGSAADIRLNKLAHPEGRRSTTLFVLTWNVEDKMELRTDLPLWLMRFNALNVLSHLGVAPSKYRLTVEDLKRYGPGIVVDHRPPNANAVLIWME